VRISDLRVFTEPQQGATYDDLLAVAARAEDLGFGAFFRSDHFLGTGTDGAPGPTDAWITLAGLARDTTTIRLGTLVSSATFRLPGPLAIAVAGVDQMSGGRIEFGFGSGWFEEEHRAYGIPFGTLGERFDNLEEQLAIVTGLWRTPAGERFSYRGRRWQLTDSPALPKPVQSGGIPVIVGGKGAKRTPQLAARFAAEFNLAFGPREQFVAQRDRVLAACAEVGREASSMIFSTALTTCCGRDEDEYRRRAAAIGQDPEDLRRTGAAGTPDEVAATLQAWAALGVQRFYLQIMDLADLDHLNLIAERVVPQL